MRSALFKLGVTGALGIGYEVVVVRVLSQVTEDTVYTFAMLLAVYLAGTAVGAAAYGAWSARIAGSARTTRVSTEASATLPERASAALLGALVAACLLGTLSLWGAESIKRQLAELLGGEGTGMAAAVAIEAALAALAFGLPTLVMGALFSHLSSHARAAGASFGLAMGVNTLGASLAPLAVGVVLLPWLGPKAVLLLLALGYLALALGEPSAWRRFSVWAPFAATGGLAALAPPLAFVDLPEGSRLVAYREGTMAAVSVVEDADGVLRLRINNRQQEGSSATRLVDGRQALLPVLLHPAPRLALFLGLGTGITAATAAQVPGLEVDAVELLPEVVASAKLFTSAFNGGEPNPRLHLVNADARRFVRASPTRYDVIVADNFHPARSGSGSLYTVEHFSAVRARLSESGLFCQWLPLHQLDVDTLRSIVKSFIAVYPQASAILASNSLETPVIGLIGRADSGRFNGPLLRERLAGADWPEGPAAHGIEDEFALLGSWVAGPRALLAFADRARANTDDLPVVAYMAPRITYAASSQPRDRLLGLLRTWEASAGAAGGPGETINAGDDDAWGRRLKAYVKARNRFLEAGRSVRPSSDLRDMLAQVQAPLLAVVEASPDFRPAYTPLWRMAVALAKTDPEAAKALLQRLVELQPSRPEAAAALRDLGANRR
jgi:spermidine synthase